MQSTELQPLIMAYNELYEEVLQLRERIAELEKQLREKDEQQKSRRDYIKYGQI